jgi:ADP-ribose pyrophosphatase YjhB (NUDIX family)
VLVELAVFTVRDERLEVLLVRGPGNRWALPADEVGEGATLAGAAAQALARQTGVRGIVAEQVVTLDRLPDAVAVAYLALIAAERHPLAPGPDVVEVRWFRHDDLPALGRAHAETLDRALRRLRARTAYAPIAFQLLPEAFTLGELRSVYEAVLDERLDPRNFRRDVLAARVVEPLERVRADGPGRPARLYRSVPGDFAVLASERRTARRVRRAGGAADTG